MRSLKSAILPIAASVAVPASAQMKPAGPSDVVSAVTTCWNAVGSQGVDTAKLRSSGWQVATAKSAQGKPIDLPLGIYGKSGVNATIIASPASAGGSSVCAVVASLRAHNDINAMIAPLQQALGSIDPTIRAGREGKGVALMALPRLALVDATGTKEKPGIRVAVGYQSSEKK